MKLEPDKLLVTLKRHNPFKVRAYSSDDDYRDIAVPTRRRRWSAVIEAIESRAWVKCELLDKSGAVLGYVDNDGPARDLSDLGTGANASQLLLAERIVQMVVKAQRDTMTFRDAETTALLQAQGAVVREMVAGMQALTQMYREQVDAASEVAALNERALAGEGGQLKELLDAAPTLLPMLPMLKSLLTGESAPPNGAKKH